MEYKLHYDLDGIVEKIKAENKKTVMSAGPDCIPGNMEEVVLLICLRPGLTPSAAVSSMKHLVSKYSRDSFKTIVQYKGMLFTVKGHIVTIIFFDYTGKSKIDKDYLLYYLAENTAI